MPQRRSTARRSDELAASRSTPNTSIRPEIFGTRPMMVRGSTDLPAPEGPTKPRISPRLTSRLSPSSTRVDPNCTVISRTRMMASEISGEASTARSLAGVMSHPDRGEEDRKHAIHHDDEEDPLHHRRRGVRSERFRAALDREPLDAGDDPA